MSGILASPLPIDYPSLVTVATFMASFQSPFAALVSEYKGSKSYLALWLASFASLVTSAILGVTDSFLAFPWLLLGAVLAVLVYVLLYYEERLVSFYSDA